MKVSFFTSTKDKGISNYSEKLINSIERSDEKNQYIIEVVGLDNVFRINGDIRKYLYSRKLFKKLGLKMNEGDIAHIQYESSLFCLWTNPFEFMYPHFRRQIKKPIILTVHELEERKRSKKWYINLIKYFYYIFLSSYVKYVNVGIFEDADALIVHTKETKQRLLDRGIEGDKIYVIELGVEEPRLSDNSIEDDKKYFNVRDKKVITTFGYISYRKGQDIVVDILKDLPENTVYLIAGTARQEEPFLSYERSLRQKIKDNGVEDRVIITGFVADEDVKRIMNATDIILSPSRDITASASITEALSYHKVVVASDLAFVKEINDDVECIETFKLNDKDDLINKVTNLLNSQEQTESLIKKTFEFTKMRDFSVIAKKTTGVYDRIYRSKINR